MPKKQDNKSLSFEGQREGEELIYVFRRHIIAIRKAFYLLLGAVVITALPVLIWQDNIEIYFLPFVGLGIGLLLFFYHYMLWYFTVYIVTNQRIRQITQSGFFGRDVIDLRLAKIQNISYSVPGFSGEVFKFGTIVIHTYVGDLVIHNVEHPDKIYEVLQTALEAVGRKENDEEDLE